jgi:GT2 family glycosyltransferase
MAPESSIILVSYNNLEYLRLCLESIYEKTEDFEVIVVDNASSDGTPDFLKAFGERHSNAQVILNTVNEGFARGNNLGIARAVGNYIVLLNSDTVVTHGWLKKLIWHLRDPEVGIVGPVTNSSANESRIEVSYRDMQEMEAFARSYTQPRQGRSFEVRMFPFFCVAMRRAVVEELGSLDEQFGIGMFEDDDYAMRVKQRGYKIVCAEDAFVHHWGRVSFSKLDQTEYWRLFKKNRDKYEKKWNLEWIPPLPRKEYIPGHVRQLIDLIVALSEQIAERDELMRALQGQVAAQTRLAQGSDMQSASIRSDRNLLQRGVRALRHYGIAYVARKLAVRVWGYGVRVIKGALRQILPYSVKNFYWEFRADYTPDDNSEVILYAPASVLPWYTKCRPIDLESDRKQSAEVKISLIATVLNESDNASEWLNSLLQQNRHPDEVVIVDGGSTDNTVAIVREFAKSAPIPIRIIESPGVKIAEGRNIAIQNAIHEVIASTDFGCSLDQNWLKYIVLPFEDDESIQFSAGYYQVRARGLWDRLYARLYVAPIDKVHPQYFMPSSRSVAMRKSFWRAIGGYPEWLTFAAEDTLFDFQAKSWPVRIAFVPCAKVCWSAPNSLRKIFKTMFRYSVGDGEAGLFVTRYWGATKSVLLTFSLFGVCLISSILLGIFWPWGLVFSAALFAFTAVVSACKHFRPLPTEPPLVLGHLTMAMAIMAAQTTGFTLGVVNRRKINRRREQEARLVNTEP